MSAHRQAVLAYLDGLGIAFTLHTHPAAHTMEDCLAVPGIDPATTEFVRNALLATASAMRTAAFAERTADAPDRQAQQRAFLRERPDFRFTLLLLRHDAPFRTADVSRALGVSRLSFAPRDVLRHLLGLEAGAVSPLGLLFDTHKRVELVMDEGLSAYECLALHPCDNTATVVLRTADLIDVFLPALGRLPRWIDPLGTDAQARE